MKLTFTTSLLLLSAATASSTNGGGLRNRRLSLFTDDSSKAASTEKISSAKADKDKGEKKGEKKGSEAKDSGKSAKADKEKTAGNVIGGSKGDKNKKEEKGRPPSGIETSDEVFYLGEAITGEFKLSSEATGRRLEDILSMAATNATDLLEEEETITMVTPDDLDATNFDNVQVHLYQYMGRPNCDGADPILSVEVTPTIVGDGTGTYQGSFSITTDDDLLEWGTGFDLFVMDGEGCKILLGPEAVTITLTPEEQAAEDAAAEEDAKKAKTPRSKAEKEKSPSQKTYKKKKEKVDKSKITVASKEALATEDYELTTDKEEYEEDEVITVTYSINAVPEATAKGRRLKQRKNKKNEPEPEPPIVITDEEIEEQAGAPVIDQPEPELQPDPLESEDEEDEEGEQQPDLLPTDLAIEEETESDPTDITKYTIGFFMKMANPQKGKLRPIHEVPLCTSESCTAAEVSSGSITITAADLDTSTNGQGIDVWILDDSGDGIAGPVFFSIDV